MNDAPVNSPSDSSPPHDAVSGIRSFGSLRLIQLAVVCVFLWMFRTLFTGQIYVTDDLLNYHYPIRQFYQNCLQNGDAFDWMPSLFSGFYLTGSGQAGTYHPFHWLLYKSLPLDIAFNLEILSSYPFLFVGMLLLLRRHVLSVEAAWLGAIAFTFSGFCTLHFLHPNAVAVVSHLPWLLFFIDRVLAPKCLMKGWGRAGEGPPEPHSTIAAHHNGSSPGASPSLERSRLTAEICLALFTGSQILLGYPQYVWYSVLAEMLYCVLAVERSRAWFRRSCLIAILKLMGLLLGAIQLLPSMEALKESERTAMSAEYFGLFPLSPADLLQWISPYVTKSRVFGLNTHELGAYFGAVPLILVAFCFLRLRAFWRTRPLVRFAVVLFIISLWLAFGRAGGLYVLQTHLPLIGKFRWPSRIVVLIHLAAALLAASVLDEVKSNPNVRFQLARLVQKFWAIPVLSFLVSAGVWILVRSVPQAPLTLMIIGPVLSGLAVLMLKDVAQGKACTGILLFVLGDLASYGFTYEALAHVQSSEQVLRDLQRPPGKPDTGKVLAETHGPDAVEGFGGNELVLAGYQQADGYEGLIPQIFLPDENLSAGVLRVMGVRWIVNAPVHAKINGLVASDDPHWLECPNPMARFRLSHRGIVEPDLLKAARLVGGESGEILQADIPFESKDLQANEVIKVVADRPGYIELQTQTEASRLLVMNERYSGGWVATSDGSPTKIVRANADFMALTAGPGANLIVLQFQPPGLRYGAVISQSTLGLLVLYAILSFTMDVRRVAKKNGL